MFACGKQSIVMMLSTECEDGVERWMRQRFHLTEDGQAISYIGKLHGVKRSVMPDLVENCKI